MRRKQSPVFVSGVFGILILVGLSGGCSFAPPEKIHLKGSPTYKLSLGETSMKPFKISSVFGLDDIRDIAPDFDIYEYAPLPGSDGNDEGILTYLLDYHTDYTIELGTEAVNFNEGFGHIDEITVATIDIPTHDGLASAAGFAIPIPGGVSLDLDALVPSVPLAININPSFTSALIGSGTITLSCNDTDYKDIVDFSSITISFTHTGDSGLVVKQLSGAAGVYSLGNETIFADTEVAIGGTVKTKPGSGAFPPGSMTVNMAIQIDRIDSMAIALTSTFTPQDIPVDFTLIQDWVKSIRFNQFGVKLGVFFGSYEEENDPDYVFDKNTGIWAEGIKVTVQETSSVLRLNVSNNIDDAAFENGAYFTLPTAPNDHYDLPVEDITSILFIQVTSEIPSGEITVHNIDLDKYAGETLSYKVRPEAVFDWEKAIVLPRAIVEKLAADRGKQLSDLTTFTFPETVLDMGEFTKSFEDILDPDLIDSISFDEVELYVFMQASGPLLDPDEDLPNSDPTTMNFNLFYTEVPGDGPIEHKIAPIPVAGTGEFNYPGLVDAYTHTLPQELRYDEVELKRAFNCRPEDFQVTATVELQEFASVNRFGDSYDVSVSPDIVIKLPLKFRMDVNDEDEDGKPIVLLDLDKILPGEQDEDLFDRTPDDDVLYKNLDGLELSLDISYINNLGLKDVKLVIDTQPGSGVNAVTVLLEDGGPHPMERISLDLEDFKAPFRPAMVLTAPEDSPGCGYALLELKREEGFEKPGFTIDNISVTAQAYIDKYYPED